MATNTHKNTFYYERIEPYPWDFSYCNNIDLHPQHHPTQNIHITHNLQVLNTPPKNETNSSWNLICGIQTSLLLKVGTFKAYIWARWQCEKLSCGKQQPKLRCQKTSMHKKNRKKLIEANFTNEHWIVPKFECYSTFHYAYTQPSTNHLNQTNIWEWN
jgi:hypothetical protein